MGVVGEGARGETTRRTGSAPVLGTAGSYTKPPTSETPPGRRNKVTNSANTRDSHTIEVRAADGTRTTRALCSHLRPSGARCANLPPVGQALCRTHSPDTAEPWLRGARRQSRDAASARRCTQVLLSRTHGNKSGQCLHTATDGSDYCSTHVLQHRDEPGAQP